MWVYSLAFISSMVFGLLMLTVALVFKDNKDKQELYENAVTLTAYTILPIFYIWTCYNL